MKQPKIVHVPGEPSPQTLRFILNLGHLLLIILLMSWMLLFHFYGKPYDNPFIVAASQLLAGRAGGVGLGLRRGFSAGFMFYQTAMVDLILMLYVYPIFVRGYQHLTLVPVVGGYLGGIHKVALRHKKRMAPYGALGLMLFVIFPFWSTGCLVGSIVGYLIGLPAWLSLLSVTTGNLIAITAWIAFYDRLQEWNETAALIFLLLIFALAAAGVLAARIHRSKKLEKANDTDDDTSDEQDDSEEAGTSDESDGSDKSDGSDESNRDADKNVSAPESPQ